MRANVFNGLVAQCPRSASKSSARASIGRGEQGLIRETKVIHIVLEEFDQAGFDTPTQRHYPVSAQTPEEALASIRNMRPFVIAGVTCGLVPGSKLSVVGTSPAARV